MREAKLFVIKVLVIFVFKKFRDFQMFLVYNLAVNKAICKDNH